MLTAVPFTGSFLQGRVRKLGLTAHVAVSVGWLGAVAAFLTLSLTALTTASPEVIRSAYLAMNLVCWTVIVPLSLAALATGVIQSLGTQWGLFRYSWVLSKFLLTVVSIALLLMHQFNVVAKAARLAATAGALPLLDLQDIGWTVTRAAALGMVALIFMLVLSIYKPWGRTGLAADDNRRPEGKPTADGSASHVTDRARRRVFLAIFVLALAVALMLHLTGHMPGMAHAPGMAHTPGHIR